MSRRFLQDLDHILLPGTIKDVWNAMLETTFIFDCRQKR